MRVDALVLEKVLRASVVASAPGGAAAGLAQLYEATVNVAEKFDDPCGTDLAAARVLLSIHAVGERKKPDAPRVLFTDVRIDRHACAALAAAGAVRVTRPRDATHLVCPQPLRRTPKFLAAVSVVEHVVTQEWLRKSGELGHAADETEHALRDAAAEREWGFDLARSLARTAPARSAWRATRCAWGRAPRTRSSLLMRNYERSPSVRAPRGSTIPLRPATRREA